MTAVFISPHLDDVAYSCGDLIASTLYGKAARVVTVFAGIPESDLPLTQYDAQCGFKSAHDAVEARHVEDARAARVLDVHPIRLPFLDQQYGTTTNVNDIRDALARLLRAVSPPVTLYAPLGLLHEDHVRVADAVLRLAEEGVHVDEAFLYEELPYRVQDPIAVARRVEHLTATVGQLRLHEPRPNDRHHHVKRAAVECYRSQMSGIAHDCLYVPERYWAMPWE